MRELDVINRNARELCETVAYVIHHGTMLVHMIEDRAGKCKIGRTTSQGPLPLNAARGTATTLRESVTNLPTTLPPLCLYSSPRAFPCLA